MGDQLGGGRGTAENNLLSGNNRANILKGKGGSDILQGFDGGDRLFGGKSKDWLYGDDGKDFLVGGKGNDLLFGGAGKDKFIFGKNQGKDTILDFELGKDLILLKRFDFKDNSKALNKFFEVGGASNDKVGFEHQGTKVIILGADLGDISADDLLI